MLEELLMLCVAGLPFILCYFFGGPLFVLMLLIWVRMAIHVYQKDLLAGANASAQAFAIFVGVGIFGGALGAYIHACR